MSISLRWSEITFFIQFYKHIAPTGAKAGPINISNNLENEGVCNSHHIVLKKNDARVNGRHSLRSIEACQSR